MKYSYAREPRIVGGIVYFPSIHCLIHIVHTENSVELQYLWEVKLLYI